MKDASTLVKFILGITTAITIIAMLEAAGAIELIDKDTYVLSGYCDNSERNLSGGVEGGGTGIDSTDAAKYLYDARIIMETKRINLHHEYYLSKAALDILFRDRTATGIFIATYFDDRDSINVLIGKSHCDHTLIDTTKTFAFMINTYCPVYCEME